MFDLRTLTKEELVEHVVKYKANSHLLSTATDEEVREWAQSKDRQFLIELGAGWGKDALIAAGLRSA